MDWVQWYYAALFALRVTLKCMGHGHSMNVDCRLLPIDMGISLPIAGRIFGWW